jgi:mRNA-degrading endonuclease HigB of HigAB toxin-antitoxin module
MYSTGMRTISETFIKDFWTNNPKSAKELRIWVAVVKSAAWVTTADVKAAFGARVDVVRTRKGSAVYVFDVANNNYRMIVAIHFLKRHAANGRVYILRLMDHEEYDEEEWKEELSHGKREDTRKPAHEIQRPLR